MAGVGWRIMVEAGGAHGNGALWRSIWFPPRSKPWQHPLIAGRGVPEERQQQELTRPLVALHPIIQYRIPYS